MNPSCDQLELYLDGELDPALADGMRSHVASCVPCQGKIEGLAHLEAMTAMAYAGVKVPAAQPRRRPRWALRRSSVFSALAVASAAGVVAVLAFPRAAPEESNLWVSMGPARELEARLSHGPADQHRPYAPMRGSGDAVRTVSLAGLARLEERGELAGIAAAFLLHGDRHLAGTFLDQMSPSAERDSDRAAVALAAGAPDQALALASSALQARPRFRQAMWNRALALRDLGRAQEAMEAFRELAALGEAGWSDEARQRAEALAGSAADRHQ